MSSLPPIDRGSMWSSDDSAGVNSTPVNPHLNCCLRSRSSSCVAVTNAFVFFGFVPAIISHSSFLPVISCNRFRPKPPRIGAPQAGFMKPIVVLGKQCQNSTAPLRSDVPRIAPRMVLCYWPLSVSAPSQGRLPDLNLSLPCSRLHAFVLTVQRRAHSCESVLPFSAQ